MFWDTLLVNFREEMVKWIMHLTSTVTKLSFYKKFILARLIALNVRRRMLVECDQSGHIKLTKIEP